jgi:c-di-GMP-binding flagellar brake protein YcgR
MPAPAGRAGAVNMLFRSQLEIGRILDTLVCGRATLWACVEDDEKLFLTRLLYVDPDGDHIVVSYCQEKPANDALLAAPSAVFHAGIEKACFEFVACQPSNTLFEGANAVRFAFPDALLRMQRREHPRFRVPPNLSLRCVADRGGFTPFEADIVDISLGGMGSMIYDAGIHLASGTILMSCKIVLPGGDALVVDLQVCHSGRVRQRNGELAIRTGFRFLQQPAGLEKLMEIFVLDLDRHGWCQ